MSRIEAAPWNSFDVAKGVGLVIVGGAGLVVLGSWLGSQDAVGALATLLLTSAGLQALLLATAFGFSVGKYGVSPEALGLCKASGKAAWLVPFVGLGASLLLTALYVGIVTILDLQTLEPPELPAVVRDAQGLRRLATAFVIIVIGPIAEETFFRGFVFQGLRGRLGLVGAAVLSAAFFSLAHGSVGLLVPVFLSGLVLTWVFVRTRCLGPAILAHSLQNFLAFVAVF